MAGQQSDPKEEEVRALAKRVEGNFAAAIDFPLWDVNQGSKETWEEKDVATIGKNKWCYSGKALARGRKGGMPMVVSGCLSVLLL